MKPLRLNKMKKDLEKALNLQGHELTQSSSRRMERRRMMEIDPHLFSRLLQISLGMDRR